MPAPSKKRAMCSVEANGNVSDDQEDDVEQMMINVEFEGRSPESSDFHSIKQLLQQLLLKAQVNISDMASILVNQSSIGSVIKQVFDDEDDDDDDDVVDSNQVFGITSILNLSDPNSECVEQLHKLVLDLSKQHGEENTSNFIQNLLKDDNKPTALLINERYINIPPPISVPLLQSISKELTKVKVKNPSNDYSYIIMICKLYKIKQSKKSNKNNHSEQVVWSNAEEEIFDEEAEYKFEFCVQNEKGSGLAGSWDEGDSEMIPYRRVIIFPAQKLDFIINKIQSSLNSQ